MPEGTRPATGVQGERRLTGDSMDAKATTGDGGSEVETARGGDGRRRLEESRGARQVAGFDLGTGGRRLAQGGRRADRGALDARVGRRGEEGTCAVCGPELECRRLELETELETLALETLELENRRRVLDGERSAGRTNGSDRGRPVYRPNWRALVIIFGFWGAAIAATECASIPAADPPGAVRELPRGSEGGRQS